MSENYMVQNVVVIITPVFKGGHYSGGCFV